LGSNPDLALPERQRNELAEVAGLSKIKIFRQDSNDPQRHLIVRKPKIKNFNLKIGVTNFSPLNANVK